MANGGTVDESSLANFHQQPELSAGLAILSTARFFSLVKGREHRASVKKKVERLKTDEDLQRS